jgi:5'-nucleotidase
MHILLTNDDGIYAPGLRALRKVLRELAEVTVVAPATEQSAAGHSVTLMNPLLTQQVYDNNELIGWAVEGRPADCVKLALLELLPRRPDYIVSGLNAGSNVGINVLYSGTVAAAVEGAFYRVPSMAISLESLNSKPLDFGWAARYARQIIEQWLASRPEPGSLINVNIPSPERGPIRGVRWVPQGMAPYHEQFHRRTDPRGRLYFWPGTLWECAEPGLDTDEKALEESYIALTPLRFDLTDREKLSQLQQHNWTVQ